MSVDRDRLAVSQVAEAKVVRMLRIPNQEPNPTEGTALVFADRKNHKGAPEEISRAALSEFWDACLGYIRPMPIDWYKAGAVVWDNLDISADCDWTAEMLALKRADADIARAYQAALLSAFVTNVGPTDLEAVHGALTTFIHTHPLFAKVVARGRWHLPYGKNTAYQLLRST